VSTGNIAAEGWPFLLGPPTVRGVLRAEPEDFRVDEIPLITPSGEGNHLWLEVEKRGANTSWVAAQLARAAGISARDVGFAGMKDRRAVTRQWFSVALQEAENVEFTDWRISGVRILRGVRHDRKLRRGALRGNRFEIRLRALSGGPDGAVDRLPERVEYLRQTGVPNYFGPQRFGRGGANLTRGLAWLQRGGRIKRSERSLFLSAVRSGLFNRVLGERVRRGDWNRLLDGEVAMLDGSHSSFECRLPDADLERRCAEFDLHPSGPLPGRPGRALQAAFEAGEVESQALAGCGEVVAALANAGVEADRRSLRVRPQGLEAELGDGELRLAFQLPAGAYATALLRELVLTGPDTISTDA